MAVIGDFLFGFNQTLGGVGASFWLEEAHGPHRIPVLQIKAHTGLSAEYVTNGNLMALHHAEKERVAPVYIVFDSQEPSCFTGLSQPKSEFCKAVNMLGFDRISVAPVTTGLERHGVLVFYEYESMVFEAEDVVAWTDLIAKMFAAAYRQKRSELMLARAQGQQDQEFEAAAKFTSTMVEQLRTPMTILTASIEGLAGGDYGNLSAHQTKALQGMSEAAQALTRLVDDFSIVTKLRAGEMRLARVAVDVVRLVGDVQLTLRALVKANGLTMTTTLTSTPTVPVHGDPARLKQVFAAVLGAAVLRAPKGSVIAVVVDVPAGSDYVVVVVEHGVNGDDVVNAGVHASSHQVVHEVVYAHHGSVATHADADRRSTTIRLPLLRS